jgi:hypothetical protein
MEGSVAQGVRIMQGRSAEDELLTALIALDKQRSGQSWAASDLVAVLKQLTDLDVPPLSVTRSLRRFVRYGWVRAEPSHDGRPGRPTMVYRFGPDGLAQAQRAAARLFGRGETWAREPLTHALLQAPPT